MKNLIMYIPKNFKNLNNKNIIKLIKMYIYILISLIILIYFLIKFKITSYFLNCFIIILFSLQPPGHMLFYNIYKNQYGLSNLKQAERFLIYFSFIIIGLKIIAELYTNHKIMINTINCSNSILIN